MRNRCIPSDISGHYCTNCGTKFVGTYGEQSAAMIEHANPAKVVAELEGRWTVTGPSSYGPFIARCERCDWTKDMSRVGSQTHEAMVAAIEHARSHDDAVVAL